MSFFAWKKAPLKIDVSSDAVISETTTLPESTYTDISSKTETISITTNTNVSITTSFAVEESNADTTIINQESRTHKPITEPVNSIHSNTIYTPVTEPVNIVRTDFKVNKIINQISAAPKFYSQEEYDTLNWLYDELSEFYGVDYRSTLDEIGFNTDEYNEYRVIADKNGNMAYDTVNFLYTNSEGNSVKLSVSKVALPYDCIYEIENKETSNIQGTDVLIGGFPVTSDPDSCKFLYGILKK